MAGVPNWPTIVQGNTGNSVSALQSLLNYANNNSALATDGVFGSGTKNAVIAYQASKGLTQSGEAGVAVLTKLTYDPYVANGTNNNAARAAQYLLNKFGAGLAVDGSFGSASTNATRTFQTNMGLTVCGSIGVTDWQYLFGYNSYPIGGGGSLTDIEIGWLAALIFYESRGFSSNFAKELVAKVVTNRVGSPLFPNSIETVLKQSGQYGYPAANMTGTLIFANSWISHPEYSACQAACYTAARKVANGTSVDENGNQWPSNVLYQHSFDNPYALGTGLYKTYYQGSFKLHFNYG